MKCPHCDKEINTVEVEPYPDELFIVVDPVKRRAPLRTDELMFRPVQSAYKTKKAAQDMGIVAGRAVYKCVRAGSTNGSGRTK